MEKIGLKSVTVCTRFGYAEVDLTQFDGLSDSIDLKLENINEENKVEKEDSHFKTPIKEKDD